MSTKVFLFNLKQKEICSMSANEQIHIQTPNLSRKIRISPTPRTWRIELPEHANTVSPPHAWTVTQPRYYLLDEWFSRKDLARLAPHLPFPSLTRVRRKSFPGKGVEEGRERESLAKGNKERVETEVVGGDSNAERLREREETFTERNKSRRKSGGAKESVAGAN